MKPSRRIGAWLAYLLVFIMISFPTMAHFQLLRQSLVALLLAWIGIRSLTTRLELDGRVVLWTLLLAAVTLFFGLRGLFLNAPGALMQMQVYVAWPLVYLVLLSALDGRILQGLDKALVFASGFVAVYVACFALSELGLIPKILPFEQLVTPQEESGGSQSAGFGEGYGLLYVAGMASLAFLIPFLFAAAASRSLRNEQRWVSRKWLLVVLFLNLPVIIFSGLRAVQAVTLLAPLLTLFFGVFLPKAERQSLMKWLRRATLALAVVVILMVPLLSLVQTVTLKGLADHFTMAFDFSASNRTDNAVGRIDQYLALMHGWEQAPFFGKGLGASAHECVRSPARPWGYELTYPDLLFQTGLAGFAAYAAGILWMYWTGIKIIRRGGAAAQFMLPALVGMSAVLLDCLASPYFRSFDTLWPIFLPLAFINHWLVTNDDKRITYPAHVPGYGRLATGAAMDD